MSIEPVSVADQVLAARRERILAGVAECREAIAEVTTERALDRVAGEATTPLSEDELRLERARRRAALERRARTLTERKSLA